MTLSATRARATHQSSRAVLGAVPDLGRSGRSREHGRCRTLDRYGHLFPSLDEALTDGLEATYQASLSARSGEPEAALSALR
ncbi:MAG: hypothetical protein ACRDY6_05725 [Acidimicrobiia bacterium]